MSVLAVGLDLVDVARVEKMIERHGDRLLHRLLSDGERSYCQSKVVPARHVAARIAAKEAAYKAFSQAGTDVVLWWGDMEVTGDSEGRPSLRLLARAQGCAEAVGASSCLLSLSHSDSQAAAIVILQS
jgi:holo-[acyl-carrier protein] synthase